MFYWRTDKNLNKLSLKGFRRMRLNFLRLSVQLRERRHMETGSQIKTIEDSEWRWKRLLRFLVTHTVRCFSSWRLQHFLLPLPAAAPPSSARGGAGPRRAQGAVPRAGSDVDLSLLDLAASLRRQVFNLLLRLQVKHHVSELLLQLRDGLVLMIACSRNTNEEEELTTTTCSNRLT